MSPTTRVSFNLPGYTKWLNESLEITDKNDYYPFGLNHIGGSKSF